MGDAAGRQYSVPKLTVPSLILGGQELGPLGGMVQYSAGLTIGSVTLPEVTRHGVLGLSALGERSTLFDLGHNNMQIFAPGAYPAVDMQNWTKMPFEGGPTSIVVTIVSNGYSLRMALDSAATASVIDVKSAQQQGARCTTSEPKRCEPLVLKSVRFDNRTVQRLSLIPTYMAGVPFDGILGIDFFRTYKIFVDFQKNTIAIKQNMPE